MEKKNLTSSDKELIRDMYRNNSIPKEEAQNILSKKFNVTPRTIRNWANALELGLSKENIVNPTKILVYDLETSRAEFKGWWTGKGYKGYRDIRREPQIITVAWKWLCEGEVKHLEWDENKSDKTLVKEFLKEYNRADMVIGYNSNKFDNRWLNWRAAKYGYDVNVFVKSFDIMKEAKRLFRMPSYSMDYLSDMFGVERKQSHEGIVMWDMIEDGTKEQHDEYISKMLDYNVGDIITTEELYVRLRKYMGHQLHSGVLEGESKFSCPNCGGYHIKLERTTTTSAGTIQRIMKCEDDSVQFKLNNKQYMNFLEYEAEND